jgi:hypothetical protein
MIKIAHRGNINGPDPSTENRPEHLVKVISQGFDVEVDVWVTGGEVFLGHDEPTYQVTAKYLESISAHAWYHCKNLLALEYFLSNMPELNFFWHEEDRFTLTSKGHIWTYPGQPFTSKSVIVDLSADNLQKYQNIPYGICTDYPTA